MKSNNWYSVIKGEEKKIEDSYGYEEMISTFNNENRDTLVRANNRLIERTIKRMLCE